MGVKLGSLDSTVRRRLAPADFQADRIIGFPGQLAMGVLSLPTAAVAGETITIGPITAAIPALVGGIAQATVIAANVFLVEVVATTTGVNTSGGQWNNTNNPIQVTVTAHGLVAGDMLAVGTEIFKIIRVIDANTLVVSRGRGGTTIAVHADAVAINKAAAPTASISVPTTGTLTPAVIGPAIAYEINNPLPTNSQDRNVAKASSIWPYLNAVSLLAGVEIVVYGIVPQAITGATTETLAGANNAWSVANLGAGVAPGFKRQFQSARVPTAAEVINGTMEFCVPFQPSIANVAVIVTSTGIETLWNGARFITQLAGSLYRITLDNSGATDWATTSTVYVEALE